MAFQLQPRSKRKDEQDRFLRNAPPPDSEDLQPPPPPPQFKEDFSDGAVRSADSFEDDEPRMRRALAITRPNPDAPVETDSSLPGTTMSNRPTQPLPYSQDEIDRAELEDRSKSNDQNPYLKKRNSKLKSALKGAVVSAGRAANRAMATGNPNILEAAAGGAAGGAVGGGINDLWDEEDKNAERKAELERDTAWRLQRRRAEADIEEQNAQAQERRAIASGKNKTQARYIERHDGVYEVSTEFPNGRKLGEIPAEVKNSSSPRKYIERKDGVYAIDDDHPDGVKLSGVPAEPESAKDMGKIPETFYRGKDGEKIKNDAMAEVLSKPEYHQTGMRQDVLDAYGGDMDKVQRAIRFGDLSPNQLFNDPSKGAMFQRDLAATHARLSGVAQFHDRELDDTSKLASAKRISPDDWDRVFDEYVKQRDAAKTPGARKAVQANFDEFKRKVRVIGE